MSYVSTVNGFGTTRYDWTQRADGTSEATLWFVVFFFPVIPIRREHLSVVATPVEQPGIFAYLAALLGAGSGWHTSIQLLGIGKASLWSILRTYFFGWVIVPLLTFVGPMVLIAASLTGLHRLGVDIKDFANKVLPFLALPMMLWAACVVAKILDRSSGRLHVNKSLQALGIDEDVTGQKIGEKEREE